MTSVQANVAEEIANAKGSGTGMTSVQVEPYPKLNPKLNPKPGHDKCAGGAIP
jgi:hypothetical protein